MTGKLTSGIANEKQRKQTQETVSLFSLKTNGVNLTHFLLTSVNYFIVKDHKR